MPKSTKNAPKRLTYKQIQRIRAAAQDKPELTTDDVVRSFRLQNYSRLSITAHIAHGRRKSGS